MNASAKETSSAYALTWSLGPVEADGANKEPALKLEYQIEAVAELYIADRLWDFDAARKRIPDPFGVYRFVQEGSLRLLLGQAPVPANVQPRIVYQPLYSRVRAGETRRGEVLLTLPVDEYSSLGRDIHAPTEIEEVSRVLLIVELRLRSDMEADPEPPPNENADDVGYIVHDPKRVTSTLEQRLPVKRRKENFTRLVLPGDPKPSAKLF